MEINVSLLAYLRSSHLLLGIGIEVFCFAVFFHFFGKFIVSLTPTDDASGSKYHEIVLLDICTSSPVRCKIAFAGNSGEKENHQNMNKYKEKLFL